MAFLHFSLTQNSISINLLSTSTNSYKANHKTWKWSPKSDCQPNMYLFQHIPQCHDSLVIKVWYNKDRIMQSLSHLLLPDLSMCLGKSDIWLVNPREGASPAPEEFISAFVWWILFSVFPWESPRMPLPLTWESKEQYKLTLKEPGSLLKQQTTTKKFSPQQQIKNLFYIVFSSEIPGWWVGSFTWQEQIKFKATKKKTHMMKQQLLQENTS